MKKKDEQPRLSAFCRRNMISMRNVLFILMLCVFEVIATNAYSQVQERNVTGIVTDDFGGPLPGVTVVIAGTTNGTTTSIDGKYSVSSVSNDTRLIFSFVGMKTHEIKVGAKAIINVKMVTDAVGLDEIVAIGYGTTTKRKAVGAISTITAEKLEQTPFTNTSEALQGQVPGLIVQSSGGAPGSTPSISIRGGATPLFVIDGVVKDEYSFGVLNPDDIASITFLKDAASTAVYGSRAGDGIVLVKTKRGKNNEIQLQYSANYQLSQPTMMPDLMNGLEWAQMHNDAARYDEIDPIFTEEQLDIIRNNEDPITYANTDWQDVALKKFATQSRHNLSLTGGGDKINYFISLGYLDQDGILKSNATSLERYNIRSNITTSFDKIGLDVSLNIDGSLQNNWEPSSGQGVFRTIGYLSSPHQPVYNEDGTYAAGNNPAAAADKASGYIKKRKKIINTQLDLKWKVPGVKGLIAGVMGSYSDIDSIGKKWRLAAPQYEPNGALAPSLAPSLSQKMFYKTILDFETSLAYSRTFGKHGIDATAVYTQRTGYYEEMEASRLDYESGAVDMLFAGPSEGQNNGGLAKENGLAGIVGRVKYDYNQKYVIELSGRYDGNDNFAPGKKWGFFPAIGTAWILSSEPFLEELKEKISLNNLKLRFSYGETGIVEDVNRFGYLATYNLESDILSLGGMLNNGYSEGNLVSPEELTWFTRKSNNIGVDFAFLKNSFEGSFDYFNYETTGYLMSPKDRYSAPLGKKLPQIKSNSVHRRTGYEISVRYKKKIKDLFFSLGANCSYYDQLWETKADEDMASLKNPYVRETHQKDFFRNMYLWDGYYQDANSVLNTPRPTGSSSIQEGDLRYVDSNGDGKIDDDDMRRVGKPDSPHFNFGIDFMVKYKGWSMNGLVQGTGDRYVDIGLRSQVPKEIVLDYQLDYWSKDNRDARFQRISTAWDNPNGLASTHKVYNAKYVRLKNLQFSYDFKYSVMKNWSAISQFKVFVTGTNLLTSSDVMDFFDPESYMAKKKGFDGNVAGSTYPVQRTYTFGVNVQF